MVPRPLQYGLLQEPSKERPDGTGHGQAPSGARQPRVQRTLGLSFCGARVLAAVATVDGFRLSGSTAEFQ